MREFEYVRAASLGEAVEAFRTSGDAVYLAGGMTLIPTLKQRFASPARLIDLSRIERLRSGVRLEGAELVVGAMTTHDAVARSSEVARSIPALASLAASIGDAQVRNRGTLGGALANNDPAADYAAAALALGATIVTDRRRIPADAFFVALFETALECDEIIVEVSFPVADRAGYAKFRQPASRYALVGVMVAKTYADVRVAVCAASPCVFRAAELESALSESFSTASIARVPILANGLLSDAHGSSSYRAHLIGVMAARAVAAAR
ncbi:MAG: FAD binding domain-containing protein [Rhodospirillales bacterium]|nr:FAD binding domain-containing protein [Rhodospirillales bacterium]